MNFGIPQFEQILFFSDITLASIAYALNVVRLNLIVMPGDQGSIVLAEVR